MMKFVLTVVAILFVATINAQITSAGSGNWNTGSTWVGGVVPTSSDNVIIAAGHTVTVNPAAAVGNNVTVNSTGILTVSASTLTLNGNIVNNGTLNVSGGTLNAQATTATFTAGSSSVLNISSGTFNYGPNGGYNRVMNYVSGSTLTVSGGIFKVNGQLSFASGSTFNQSGGTIYVDGNAAGNTTNSVTSAMGAILLFNSNLLNLTGGTLICVDPHASTTASLSVSYNSATNNATATGTHTFQVGDGSSTDAGGNATNQFRVDLYTGSYRLNLQNYVINAPAGTNRAVTQPFTQGCNGNLTITAGDLQTSSTLFVGGNISNSGTMTTTGTLSLGTSTGTSVVATSSAQTIDGTGVFRNNATSASSTANFASLTINNTNATGVSFNSVQSLLCITGGVTNTGTVRGTLTLTTGNVNLSGNTFVLGISAGTNGTMAWTAGGFFNGALRRWYSTTGLATTIGGTSTIFPFVTSSGVNRNASIARSAAFATGGWIQIQPNEVLGQTTVSIADVTPAYTIDRRTNANWVTSSGGGINFGTANMLLRLQGDGLIIPTTLANVRICQASAVVGTYSAGTGSVAAPQGNRTAIPSASFAGTYYLGINNADQTPFIQTAQSGPWGVTTTWLGGVVPSSTDLAIINATHTVTLDGANVAGRVQVNANGAITASSNSLTVTGGSTTGIVNNGTITVSGGTITLGPTGGGNRTMSCASGSTLTVSSGNLNINGNLSLASGSAFNQSGGTISVDGNAAGVVANSVTNTTGALIDINTSTLNLTGGTLVCVDPHASTTTSISLRYNNATTYTAGAGHTVKFGNGTSTDAGGTTNCYQMNLVAGTGRFNPANMLIDAPVGTNRKVTTSVSTQGINGNLTITQGEFVVSINTFFVGGDITNNGILTTTGTLTLGAGAATGTSVVASTTTQTISGTGSFYNNATPASSTGNFSNLTINNSNATGVSFGNANSLLSGTNTGTVSSTLNLTVGRISTGSNTFVLGVSVGSNGTLSYAAGGFLPGSTFGHWYSITSMPTTAGANGTFPFITSAGDVRNFVVSRNATSFTTGGIFNVSHTNTTGVSPVTVADGAYTIEIRSNSNWTVAATSSLDIGIAQLTYAIRGDNATTPTVLTNFRMLKAASVVGTHVAGSGSLANPVANRNSILSADYTGTFYVGYNSADGAAGTIQSAQTGPWSVGSTWVGGVAPTSIDAAIINNGHNVTIDGTNAASTLTINAGGILTGSGSNTLTVGALLTNSGTVNTTSGTINIGTTITNNGTINVNGGTLNAIAATAAFTPASGSALNISAGTFNFGPAGGYNLVYQNVTGSTLNVSGGTFNINGRLFHNAGTFTQTGGNINVDANSGTAVTSFTTAVNGIVHFSGGTISATAGTITVVDPPHNSVGAGSSLGVYSLYIGISGANNTAFSGTHTFVMGDGVSTTPGNTTDGFGIETYASGAWSIQNLTINGGSVAGRHTTPSFNTTSSYGVFIKGNLTINSGSELRTVYSGPQLGVSGNITNNGTLTYSNATALVLGNLATPGYTAVSAQTISGSGVFRNSTTTITANYSSLTINNTNGVNFASASSVSGSGTGTVSGTFTLTVGKVGLGSGANTFTLGTAIATPGTLSYSAGGFTDGTFNRWYGGATVTLGNAPGQYPFLSAANNNRSAFFGTSGAITGGQLAVRYNDATGVTVVTPFNDNGVDIEKVSNANWVVSNTALNLGASTGLLRMRGDGITTVTSVANVRLTGATAIAPGNSVAGTGTVANPAGNKNTMAVADLTNTTFYFSVPNVIQSIATGNWSNTATWDCACVPSSGDNVIINATHNVTLDGANAAGSVTISANGTLTASANSLTVDNSIANSGTITLSGGTITQGAAGGGNSTYGQTVAGAVLNMSAGTFNINGNFNMSNGTFTQTGGDINIDGNSGTAGTSVASGTNLFNITGGTVNCSAGTIDIVDPPHSSYATGSTKSVNISLTSNGNAFTGTHTIMLGDGVSTTPGNNDGFVIDGYASGIVPFRNVIVNGGNTTGRWASVALITGNYGMHVAGTLTINAGSELRHTIANQFVVAGNIVNNGTLTETTTTGLTLGDIASTPAITAAAQSVSGSGVFRNATSAPTASISSLTFNNNSTSVVTIGVNNLSISGTLTFTNGNIALGSNNMTLGFGTANTGTLTYTNGGFISGTFTRWFGTAAISIGGATNRFPFIASATAQNRSAFFGTSGATSGGTISVTYNDAVGTTDVSPITDLGVDVTKRSNANWTVANSFTFGASTGQLRLQGQGIFPVVANFADMRITGASALAAGTSIAGTGTNANPAGNKTTMTSADLTGTFYVGLPNVINSIATGNWDATTTWDCACVPTSADIVVINNTHNVTLSGANAATTVTINSGGTLTSNNAAFSLTVSNVLTNNGTMTISAGTVNYGPAGGGNRVYTLATGATLTLSGGTFNVNGNVSLTGGSFTMSSGNFNIDGNDGTPAGSVASGTNLFSITLATALTQSVTGGTITIVDPPYSGTGLSFTTASSGNNPVWTGNTLVLGGSTGTNATTATVGFIVDTYAGTGRLQLGNVIANGGNTTDRFTSSSTSTSNGTNMTNLTINAGSEFRTVAATSVTVAGNVTNNGTLTVQSGHTLSLAALSGTSVVASALAQTISGTGTFRNALTSPTASFGNLLFNNNGLGITIGVNNLSVSGTLTFTSGNVSLGTNTFSLGFNTTNIGTLSYTAGGFVSGNFTRWYGTATETIGLTSDLYPFVSGANDRNAYFGTSGVTSGGSVTVGYVEVPGVTDVTAFPDLGVDISKVSNSYWTVSNSFNFGASTGQLRLRAPGLFTTLANVADIRITGATASAPGTSSVGTGTVALPRANKVDMTSADLSGNFYVGIPSVINSIATGNWSSPTTWDCSCVPTLSDAVVINNTHNVTIDGANAASSLTISTGGILTAAANSLTLRGAIANSGTVTLSGGTITQGNAGGGNANFTNSTGGSYTISSGTHNINGSVNVNGGTFTQSGGNIIVDGNANNVLASSVSNQPIVYFGAATYSLTGGTFTIVDPHANGVNYEVFRYDNGSSYNADAAHTFQFGDGVSTTPALTTDGIDFDPFFGFGRLQFGNLVVNTATGINRYVQPLDNYGIVGNLTVTSGEYRSNTWITYVNGNISVASGATLTADATIALANFASGSQTASTNAQTISGAGTFRNLVASPTANLTNLTINNSNATGVTISNNLSVSGTLTFTAGRVVLGSNTFTLGVSTTSPGTLSYTAGGFVSGTFNRWYGTATVTVGNAAGRYPFISGTDDRSAFFGTSGAITGGTVSVNYTDAAGTTPVTSFLDSGSGIAKVSNANWAVSNSINLGASTAFFRLRGSNITSTSDFSAVRITSATGLFAGTSIPGTGSNAAPEGNKAAMSAANLSGNMRIGYPNFIIAVANGNWNTASTWDCNCVPTAGDNATIPSPYTVTVNATSVGAGLTINSGGGLTVSGGSLTLGGNIANSGTYNQSAGTVTLGNIGGGNASFTNPSGSAFTLSLGTLNVNGNLNTVGATFTQTGGTINIDANSGTAATSTLAAVDLCFIGATTINCSAGTLRIVDPPHSSISSTTRSLVINSGTSTTAFSGTHTVEFGNGVSTTPGNTDGFIIETYNSGRVPLNNVTVNAGSATGRWTNGSFSGSSYGTHINGTFTINVGSEARTNTNASEYSLGGNLVNNGTFTVEKTLNLGSIGLYTITTPQTISGTGTFRNLSASPTANYTGLTINNSGGVTFSTSQSTSGVGTGTVSGTLTMTLGNITLGSNTFTIGTSAAAPGTLSYTAGFFTNGTLSRWIGTSAIAIGNTAGRFPFGSGTNDRSYYAGTSAAITTGGRVNVNYIDASGTTAVSISDAGSSVTARSNARWVVSQTGLVLGSATYLSRIQGNGVGTVTDFAASRQVFASAIAGGASTAGTGSNTLPAANKSITSTADIAGTFYFGIGTITCAPPTALTATNITTASADLGWTAGGTETAWDIEWMLASATPTGIPNVTGTTTNPYPLGGLSSGTSYKYYVRASCGGSLGNSPWVGPFTFSTLFPAATNDLVCGAIPLTVNEQAVFATYSNTGATTDAAPSVASSCQSSINSDVWFSAVVPTEGTMSVYFRSGSTGTPLTDMVLHVYSSSNNTCSGTLTEIGCNDDGGPSTLPFAHLTGLTPGATLFIRASDYSTVDIGTFDIAVTPYWQWTGATSTTWATAANWLSGDGTSVPGTTSNVLIPNVANDPVNAAGTGIAGIKVLPGATVTNSGGNLTVRTFLVSNNAQFLGSNFVVMVGTSAQTISGNGSTFTNLRINNAAGVTVAAGANMQTITTLLDMRSGNLTSNGNITIQSTATTQAYIDDFSSGNTGTISGNVRIERYITSGPNGFRYIGTPVATTAGGSTLALSAMSGFVISGTPGQLIPLINCSPNNSAMNSPYGTFMRWEEPGPYTLSCRQQGWWFQTSGTMTVARGYGAKLSGGNKVTYTGVPNTGNSPAYTCTSTNVFAPSLNGWNLVANPYPSNMRIDNTDGNANNNMPAGFDGQVQFYQTSGPFSGSYLTFNVGLTSPPIQPIALGQGFWVKVSNTGTANWSLSNNHRITTTATYYNTNSNVAHHLEVDVSGNGFMDQTHINFKGDGQTGFDNFDANKWDSRAEQPTLYTSIGSEQASINTLPSLEETVVVPMGLKPGTSGNFSFTFEDVATFPQSAIIYLEDKKLGTMTNIRTINSYDFSSSTNDNIDRFALHFQPGLQAEVSDQDCDNAGSIELTQPAPTVWSTYEVKGNDNNVYAQGTNLTGSVTINNLPAQEYVVTVTHPSGYSAQEYITVNGSSPVNATINVSATNVMVDEMVSLTATATNATEYVWNFGDGNTQSGSSSVVHTYDAAGTYNVTVTASSNTCTDVATKTIVVGNTTGINTAESGLTVNGVGTNVVIEFNNWGNGKANIMMFDMLGQEINSLTGVSTINGRQEIRVTDIKPGYYLVRVISGDKIYTRKLFLTADE